MLATMLALALAPISVAGHDVAEADLTARVAASGASERTVGDTVTEALWVDGEAMRLGVVAAPERVDQAVRNEIHSFGDEEVWREEIRPETPEQARERIARQVLRAGIAARLTLHATSPGQFSAAFEAYHARWRAVTRCTERWRVSYNERCANKPRNRKPCRWMGAADVCGIDRGWLIVVDLGTLLYPGRVLTAATAARAVRAVRREMGSANRRLDIDTAPDSQVLRSRDRGTIVRAAHAIERLVQRSAAGQAIR